MKENLYKKSSWSFESLKDVVIYNFNVNITLFSVSSEKEKWNDSVSFVVYISIMMIFFLDLLLKNLEPLKGKIVFWWGDHDAFVDDICL